MSLLWTQLSSFIDDNKSNISFVFHVMPTFSDVQILCNELARHTKSRPYFMEHSFPDKEQAVTYVEKQLKESGLELDSSGKKAMKKLIDEKIDTTSSAYHGYKTLEAFVSSLQFELYANASKMGEEDDTLVIGKDEVNLISDFVDVLVETVIVETNCSCSFGVID